MTKVITINEKGNTALTASDPMDVLTALLFCHDLNASNPNGDKPICNQTSFNICPECDECAIGRVILKGLKGWGSGKGKTCTGDRQ